MVNPGGYSTETGTLQAVPSGSRVTEQQQGRRDAITPTVDRLRFIPEVSNVVANLLADYETLFFNDGSCNNDSQNGVYKHICLFCHKQGRSMNHPESKCTAKSGSKIQDFKNSASR